MKSPTTRPPLVPIFKLKGKYIIFDKISKNLRFQKHDNGEQNK
jgi:hypothetical protein